MYSPTSPTYIVGYTTILPITSIIPAHPLISGAPATAFYHFKIFLEKNQFVIQNNKRTQISLSSNLFTSTLSTYSRKTYRTVQKPTFPTTYQVISNLILYGRISYCTRSRLPMVPVWYLHLNELHGRKTCLSYHICGYGIK